MLKGWQKCTFIFHIATLCLQGKPAEMLPCCHRHCWLIQQYLFIYYLQYPRHNCQGCGSPGLQLVRSPRLLCNPLQILLRGLLLTPLYACPSGRHFKYLRHSRARKGATSLNLLGFGAGQLHSKWVGGLTSRGIPFAPRLRWACPWSLSRRISMRRRRRRTDPIG